MPRTAALAIADIIEAIDGISAALQGRTFEEFRSDWLLRHGVQRGIESSRRQAATFRRT